MSDTSGQAFTGRFDPATSAILPSAQATQVHLLRHGEVAELTQRVVRGQMDVELSPRGRAHGTALARWFANVEARPTRLFASDLVRCTALAGELGELVALPPRLDARLREQSMGAWEGRTWAEITRAEPAAVTAYWDDYYRARPQGGESLQDLERRVLDWWQETFARDAGERIAVVTHIGVIRVLLSHFLNLPASQSLRFAPATASHTCVTLGEAGAVVLSLGERPWTHSGTHAATHDGAGA
jgi:broad specificity phosphatase PhoE